MLILQMPAPDTPRMLPFVDFIALRAFEVGVGARSWAGGVEGIVWGEHDGWCGGVGRFESGGGALLGGGGFATAAFALRGLGFGGRDGWIGLEGGG